MSESDSEIEATTITTTTIVPFDGRGRDPKSLIGRKIQRHYKSGKGISLLTFKCQDGSVQFVNEIDLVGYEEYITQNDDMSWFHLDRNLKDGLRSLGREGRIIEDACVGERKVGEESFRVVGIKVAGMAEVGYIYCKKSERTVTA